MSCIIRDEHIEIREMEDTLQDYELMAKWLSDPVVLEYYEGRNNPFDLEKIIKKYKSRAQKKSSVKPCIILFNRQEIGYIQYYPILDDYETKGAIDFKVHAAPYGLDLFIGEVTFWNRGIGTLAIKLLLKFLFENNTSDIVFIDPKTCNTRAIKSYEKCGFLPVTVIERREEHEGVLKDSLIMSISNNSIKCDKSC